MLFINYFQGVKVKQLCKNGGINPPLIIVKNNKIRYTTFKNIILYNPGLTLYKKRNVVKFRKENYYFVFLFLSLSFGIFYMKFKMFIINIYI